MSILDTCARNLAASGYAIATSTTELRFEDASVLGFVAEFETVAALLAGWQSAEETFLRTHAAALRRDPRKAWNLYTVLLTPEPAATEQRGTLFAIEENFRATRKLARAGISTERDVENALGALLPIRHRMDLTNEDVLELVNGRLSALPSEAVRSLLDDATGDGFAEALLRGEESR